MRLRCTVAGAASDSDLRALREGECVLDVHAKIAHRALNLCVPEQDHRDDEGRECADYEAARVEAMHALPEIARIAIPADGDEQAFNVLVRNEGGKVVYMAVLSFKRLRLHEDEQAATLAAQARLSSA